MYWPIGAPRIYAAGNGLPSKERVLHSDDGVESSEVPDNIGIISSPPSSAPDVIHDGEGGDSGLLAPSTPTSPVSSLGKHDTQQRRATNAAKNHEDEIGDALRQAEEEHILSLRISRSGHLFAVITTTSLTIWQTKPTAVLAVVVRSISSLENYGPNVSLLVRPDSAIFVVQTTNGYLITYSLASEPDTRVFKPHFPENTSVHTRRLSNFARSRGQEDRILWGPGEGGGIREISVRFRRAIKVDAGIGKALALDDELVVATEKPAAVQCIRWSPDSKGNQTSTELLSRMTWLPKKIGVLEMEYDRPMNLSAWITDDGKAYAVQRLSEEAALERPNGSADDLGEAKSSEKPTQLETSKKLFRGYCFHTPKDPNHYACKAAINARFSLLAVGCADGSILIYTARDYAGNIPFSHRHELSVSPSSSGKVTFLAYSPDGYCLFAGYQHGWATWSVFGKPGSTSFGSDRSISGANDEGWLEGVQDGAWLTGGSEILLVGKRDARIWVLEMARSAVTGCFTKANISRTMLHTRSSIMVYRGYDLPDLTTISSDASLWHISQIPSMYLRDQWPIRCTVISSDGRYVAVAGRHGLAHYSIKSGRWKTFVDGDMENGFQVRGGMCWHQHILVAAVEDGDAYEIRLYSREAALDNSLVLHTENLPAPVVLIAPSGEDSLLVYTHDNLLYHYIFATANSSVKLVQVGQIAFHGIVRSPARVRGLSWILPDDQLQDGDPSQDVAVATVIFLVDGKLVLLQPSLNQERNLKYDMRVIAQNVEYYTIMKDLASLYLARADETTSSPSSEQDPRGYGNSNPLRDSLWMFDGIEMRVWSNVHDVLRSAPSELGSELPAAVRVAVDFYPLSILLHKGILLGVEPELVQRRDVIFSFFRFAIRTQLFLPELLRSHLSQYDSSAALQLARNYRHLEYFAHALEILLHQVLDEEVDFAPSPEMALLPRVLSFLSSFPEYLDIVVQCTRKTEVRSWRTLFSYLPPPAELFEESLQKGSLKTAGGYLLVLHTFEELSSSSEQLIRLLACAKEEGDWELCKELARFLIALDESGATLREALEMVDLRSPPLEPSGGSFMFEGSRLKVPRSGRSSSSGTDNGSNSGPDGQSRSNSRSPTSSPTTGVARRLERLSTDYFSAHAT